MRVLRLCLGWVFALLALFCLLAAVIGFSAMFQPPHEVNAILLAMAWGIILAAAFTFGMAWWTVLRRKPSERRWGLTASSATILAFLAPFLVDLHPHGDHAQGALLMQSAWPGLVLGVLGLIAFLPRYKKLDCPEKTQGLRAIAGDGTSSLVSKGFGVLACAAIWESGSWWMDVCKKRNIPAVLQGEFPWTFMTIALIVFVAVILHEAGHATAGLAQGMQLRAFVVGPFEWRVRDGKWTYRFVAKNILSGGAAGLVPPAADFPKSGHLWMTAGGPLANLVTGLAAIWMALNTGSGSSVQLDGALGIFGEISLAFFVLSLIPFKSKSGYSDGAQIYQLLSNGPWGDYHQVLSVVASSLVTSIRPRDFEIDTIQRAASGITRGREGLLLRLYANAYYQDWGRNDEAAQALREASAIYEQSASDIPAELHTVFVFGAAFTLRDAAAARQWWERMEAKKPTRFNVDYWRAKSALCWIEGNLQEADEAWAKSDAAAQELPHAGAYEFDRHLCGLLREAIEAAAAETADSAAGSFAR